MSQEQQSYNKDEKQKLPRFNSSNRPPGEEPPKKGPRFSIYWVYAIIFAVLIGFRFTALLLRIWLRQPQMSLKPWWHPGMLKTMLL